MVFRVGAMRAESFRFLFSDTLSKLHREKQDQVEVNEEVLDLFRPSSPTAPAGGGVGQ